MLSERPDKQRGAKKFSKEEVKELVETRSGDLAGYRNWYSVMKPPLCGRSFQSVYGRIERVDSSQKEVEYTLFQSVHGRIEGS
jgi:hypothetical protein